jgi:hypothetical protein
MGRHHIRDRQIRDSLTPYGVNKCHQVGIHVFTEPGTGTMQGWQGVVFPGVVFGFF